MHERTIVVMNSSGLHARPAASFVKLASTFISDVSVEHKGNKANGKSIVEMMMVAADQGDEITIRVSGEDEQAAMDALAKFVSEEHDSP
jgi:phosphotransferase system HPr (HPr) family protein